MKETKAQAEQNAEQLERHNAELQAQNEALKKQQEQADRQQQEIRATQEKVAANRAQIEAAIARFGQLDDYYIFDEVTVYFANGKSAIDPKYKQPLLDLASKAKTIDAYTIEVKGYASSIGSAVSNQRLSQDRANNVSNFLLQQGHLSLTHLLAPGAMGESEQIGDEKTKAGQA